MGRKIDLRFIEIGYELAVLRQSIQILERHLQGAVDTEIARLYESLNQTDETAWSEAQFREDELQSGVLIRSVTGAPLLAGWGAYEAAVAKLACSIQQCRGVSLTLSDLRGSFVSRARKYFCDVLAFDLHPVGADWHRLEMIAAVRHCLAHANGRIPDVRDGNRPRLVEYAQATQGLKLEGEYLVVTLSFARATIEFLKELLDDLVQRTCSTFPTAKDVA